MKDVKCNFKNVTTEEKKGFKHSSCILLISVGQEAHEGERFSATIDLINSSFNSCIVPNYPNLLHSLTLRFRNAPQLKPQFSEVEGKIAIT